MQTEHAKRTYVDFPLYAIILVTLLCSGRLIIRAYRENKMQQSDMETVKRVLIIGAGCAGEGLVRDLKRLNNYTAVGLLDDLLDAVTKDPKTFAIFVTSVAGIIVSTPAMLIAIVTCILLKLIRLPHIALAVIGLNVITIAIIWIFS